MKPFLLALLALLAILTGCDAPTDTVSTDQCMRNKIFMQCLRELPAGPTNTNFNDWSEVVDQCDTVAMYQSRRNSKWVSPSCAM